MDAGTAFARTTRRRHAECTSAGSPWALEHRAGLRVRLELLDPFLHWRRRLLALHLAALRLLFRPLPRLQSFPPTVTSNHRSRHPGTTCTGRSPSPLSVHRSHIPRARRARAYLRTFGSVFFPLVFISAQSVPEVLWSIWGRLVFNSRAFPNVAGNTQKVRCHVPHRLHGRPRPPAEPAGNPGTVRTTV